MPESISFPVGARRNRAPHIVPVFLPFRGCPGKCVYCAQDRQTGEERPREIQQILMEAASIIDRQNHPCELAFYGGTFTAMPEKDRRLCLDFLRSLRAAGRVSAARCSTRPDTLGKDVLQDLQDSGISLVELGIQSFSSDALAAARRGYSGEQAIEGCQAVRKSGLKLGVQLLPGMPGCSPEVFLKDVSTALGLHPDCMRFYPCLIPDGTVLAEWFANGRYAPWTLEQTVSTLGKALARAWQAGVPVIRLSVAPEPSFDNVILAGPRHPALGSLIQAEALLLTVEQAAMDLRRGAARLELPRFCQGFMYGSNGSMRPRWNALGLGPEHIFYTDEETGRLS